MDESSKEDKSHFSTQHRVTDATSMSLNRSAIEALLLMTSEHEANNDSATTEAGYQREGTSENEVTAIVCFS